MGNGPKTEPKSGLNGGAKSDAKSEQTPWHAIVHEALKRNDVRLITYVPDRVLTPHRQRHKDAFFTAFVTTRRRRRSASSRAPGWPGCVAPC